MQNTTDEYRKFRYYEGVCSSGDFIKEIAKVLSLGVKKDAIKDVDGNIVTPSLVLKKKNWDIVYPMYNGNEPWAEGLNTNYDHVVKTLTIDQHIAKIENQISQITNSVVLRTTTTEHEIKDHETEELSVSGDVEETKKTMYVQFYKPDFLANPEEYPLDAELIGLTPQVITKEMYKDARKSTSSVIYDMARLAKKVNFPSHEGLVTSTKQVEFVDSVSNPYELDDLFGQAGILNELAGIFGKEDISEIPITVPRDQTPTTYFDIDKVHLNSIKNNSLALYDFIMGICNLRSTFTREDYDLINVLHVQITYTKLNGKDSYTLTFTYEKNVEVFTIHATDGETGNYRGIDLNAEYGHIGMEGVRPEIYSEGRYVPLPKEYLGDIVPESVKFTKDVKFSLDKVQDDDIFYGTIVLRYNYNKNFTYTDLSSLKITDSVTVPNNHYCLIRMFDSPALDFSGPNPNITDNEGNITTQNSHISPWSKLSWYKDFEEIMMDHIDEDISTTSISDGTLLVPLETAGLSADTRISYWVNTNNDRVSLIVMGNPALDYEKDRHLISSCYIGRIDSFEGSINDTSGNFALYTSSSTTPCKTEVETNDTQYHLNRKYQNELFVEAIDNDDDTIFEEYKAHCKDLGGFFECTNYTDARLQNLNAYYITLTGNKFFNENEMPRYMMFDKDGYPINLSGNPNAPVYYRTVAYREFIYGTSDSRSSQVAIYIPERGASFDGATIYFNFGYYEEKFVITSGITRDAFGNVIDIQTIDEYGKNTSDGTTSISMYHTRSKAFYQKHHMLFATTEEYMSKVMYGKSSYTGEYYADRIKVTHGNDGPRGILSDVLVIDSSSLYPKDELVINKEFKKDPNEMEETFVYFPVTAPFSPFSDGPNARYGIALKKEEKEPVYTDYNKIVNIGKDEVKTSMANDLVISRDTKLPYILTNGCKVYYEIVPGSSWIGMDENEEDSQSIEFYDTIGDLNSYTGRYIEASNLEITVLADPEHTSDDKINAISSESDQPKGEISKGSKATIDFKSELKIKANSASDIPADVKFYYGISDKDYSPNGKDTIFGGTDYAMKLHDHITQQEVTEEMKRSGKYGTEYTYSYYSLPISLYVNRDAQEDDDTIEVKATNSPLPLDNADPNMFLNVFAVSTAEATKNKIMDVWSFKLNKEVKSENPAETVTLYDLLQFPCKIFVYVTSGGEDKGIITAGNVIKPEYYSYNYNDYKNSKSIEISVSGASIAIDKVHYYEEPYHTVNIINGTTYEIPASQVDDDLYVNVQFDIED